MGIQLDQLADQFGPGVEPFQLDRYVEHAFGIDDDRRVDVVSHPVVEDHRGVADPYR